MKLGSVKISNFRSVSETTFCLDDNVTAIVGGNESGKSNCLLAINNFLNQIPFADEDRYWLTDNPPEVTITFSSFTEKETRMLTQLCGTENISELQIRRTNSKYEIVSPTIKIKSVSDWEKENSADNEVEEIPLSEPQENSADQQVQVTNTEVMPNAENSEAPVVPPVVVRKAAYKPPTVQFITNEILNLMPKAELIGSVEQMIVGENLSIQELFHKEQKDERILVVRKLLEIGGLKRKDLREPDLNKRVQLLNKGAARIAARLRTSWHQEDIKMMIVSDRKQVTLLFRDCQNVPDKQGNDDTKWIWTSPKLRSVGFRWYITFYARYLSALENPDNNLVLLIDDAGSPLNKKAQEDLLQEFNRLSEGQNNQIIYVTHSRYMVSWDMRKKILVAIKQKGEGTKLSDMWWIKFSQNALPAPLDELGASWIEDILSTNNLITEGYTDVYILRQLSAKMANLDLPDDPFAGFTVVPAGGVDPQIELGSLCKTAKKKVYLLFDSDGIGSTSKEKASNAPFELPCNDINSLCNNPAFKVTTIEDLLPRSLYTQAANKSGKSYFKERWTEIGNIRNADDLGIVNALKQRLVNDGLVPDQVSNFVKIRKYEIAKQAIADLNPSSSYTNQEQVLAIKNLFQGLKAALS